MDHAEICVPPFRILAAPDKLPDLHAHYQSHALLFESFALATSDGAFCFFAVGRIEAVWPELVVSQRYSPAGHSFNPGILVTRDTNLAFIGAGTRVLAYQLLPSPRRLWEDCADVGFWQWAQHGDTVLMSAELELAAWSSTGEKRWSTFVEPPWHYEVREREVELDVMGTIRKFPLVTGPRG